MSEEQRQNPQEVIKYRQIDLLRAHAVQLVSDGTGKCWVNVDGVCVLRVGQADRIEVDDESEINIIYG